MPIVTATGKAEFRGGPMSALAVRPFFWWFGSQVLSSSGLMTQMVAAGWLVLHWHGNGVQLGLLTSAGLGPTLLLGLWMGSLVDHHDRRTILIWTQSLLATLSLLLFALIISGTASYWPLIAITVATGAVNALDAPARQIYVLDIVGPERLAGAVSLYEVILNLSRVLGPAVGGGLLATSGAAACVLVNALTFLAPLAVLLHHRASASASVSRLSASDAAEEPVPLPSARPSAMEGLRYAWSRPLLRACLLLAASSGVLYAPTLFFPLMATRVFHLGGSGYGLLLALFGIGALPGALLAARRQPTGRHVRVLGLLTGVSVLVAATAPDLPVLFVGIVATGTTSIWMVAAANTLVQLRTAPELRGRVMGAWTMALPGTNPITVLAAGAVADALGPRVAYGGAGVIIACVALLGWRAFVTVSDG
jgi:MFS family permease